MSDVLLHSNDTPESRELLERVLRDGAEIASEYPLVFGETSPGRMISIGSGEEHGEVHSACAILARELVTPQARIKVGLIGSVATDPAWQGKGLATRILVEAEAALEREGCHVALLWADDPSFYYVRGYRPLGAEADYVVPRACAARLPRAEGVRVMTDDDCGTVHALYTQHASRVDRAPEETCALLACPGMETLVLERDGAVVAYACRGRGLDLQDAIHEWGGDVDDVLALLRAHLERRFPDQEPDAEQGRLFLMAPATEGTLHQRLQEAGVEGHLGVLGLGKVLDRQAAATLLNDLLTPAATVTLDTSGRPDCFRMTAGDEDVYLDEDSFLALLLPAYGLDEEVKAFQERFGLEAAPIPLQPFAWGLDSI